ncbi:hypothetical protein [Bacillus mojavensis]
MSDDLELIKRKLRDEEKIEDLLSAIGCEYIKTEQRGYLYVAQLPERFHSDNKRSVQVKMNDSMTCHIRNRSEFSGDIFNLISYIHHDARGNLQNDLHNAKEFICRTFGWTDFLKGKKRKIKEDPTACLKQIVNRRKKKPEIKPNPVLPESVLNDYYFKGSPLPYEGWIDEGISYETQTMYGIGFDLDTKRITIPMRNRFGELVGVKGRILKDEDDERKYLYIYRYQNRFEWFNFHYAHPYILMDKKVYIFEAEKSCMKAFEYGIFNTVAVGSSEISPEQALMIKQLGMDIEIVLCYDKGITKDEIKKNAELFNGRKVYAMFDVNDLLEDKNSPVDQGVDTWRKLHETSVFEIKQKKAS